MSTALLHFVCFRLLELTWALRSLASQCGKTLGLKSFRTTKDTGPRLPGFPFVEKMCLLEKLLELNLQDTQPQPYMTPSA